jgi:LDH2 family malate/lactate/ureidoglycolate dehydrogenase
MQLTVAEARRLVDEAMRVIGLDPDEAALVADHLVDCELRGVHYGGLPRALSIAERVRRTNVTPRPIRVEHETPVSARIDGGDRIGYVVAHRATRIAIDKAAAAGIAVVGAHNTWYTGMLSYYAEMATAQGLVAIIASNASPWVAPHGAAEGRVGTNPICVGFPSSEDPVIWDIGTSAIMHAEVKLAQRLGQPLPEGVAFDAAGRPTIDPNAALEGALAAWGGHKGSGLAIVVQILGGLAGAPFIPPELAGFGFLLLAMRPDLLTPPGEFAAGVADFAAAVRNARPLQAGEPVRMPFDRSRAERRRRLSEDGIDVPEAVYSALRDVAAGGQRRAGQP